MGGRDELREQLLDAALRVFASQGYEGTRIGDIVREAGLSTGAVYGRFRSKNDLLREAVVRGASVSPEPLPDVERVADVILRVASRMDEELSLYDAVRLEAYVAARREPEVARAIEDAFDQSRAALEPLVQAAIADGTVAADIDPETVLFYVRTLALGLLLQRAAGGKTPDPAHWDRLMRRIIASFGT